MPFLLVLLLALAPVTRPADLPEFVEFDLPMPVLLGPAGVERLRAIVEAQPVAFAAMRAEAEAAVDVVPSPIAEIKYEGHVSNHPDRRRTAFHLQDMRRLHALNWVAAVTGEPQYLDAARQIVAAWVPVSRPTGNDVNDNKLNPIIVFYHLFKDDLPAGERAATRAWVEQLLDVHEQHMSRDGQGNRFAKRVKLVALAAIALDDKAAVEASTKALRAYLARSLRANGTSFDYEQRDALHYHVGGLDIPMEVALNLAANGDPAALTLYATPIAEGPNTGASLKKSVAFVLPYARGEKVHPEWRNSRVPLDRQRWESGDPYYRPGKPYDPSHAAKLIRLASAFDPALRGLAADLAATDTPEDAWTVQLIEAATPAAE
jgi:hypothetical protein